MPRRSSQATQRPVQPRPQRFTRQQPAARFAAPAAPAAPAARAVPRKTPPQHGRGR
jgi:hypothetical protein